MKVIKKVIKQKFKDMRIGSTIFSKMIFKNPSIAMRIAIGKMVGFIIGIMTVDSLSSLVPNISLMFQIGMVLWYTTFGAIIGIFGISTKHPLLNFHLSWWVRSFIIGMWMHLILTFFAYNELSNFVITIFGKDGFTQSPFWFVPQGGFIGVIMGYFITVLQGGEKPRY